MRVQACPVPTAVFSNHTGFAAFACQDLTAFLPSYLEQWKQLNLTFDGVLCGFLGQAEQILSVSSFLSDQKSRGCQTILVDPSWAITENPIARSHQNTVKAAQPDSAGRHHYAQYHGSMPFDGYALERRLLE